MAADKGVFFAKVGGIGRNYWQIPSFAESFFSFDPVDFAFSRTDGAVFEPMQSRLDFFLEKILRKGF
jgi:hypothetical protein